ncbi:MAG: HDIG domain-containing protein [Dehalococcoidia bacterium]|nr:HDIG domain-containing protein [Dehalococcoidia bacterium]
MLTRSPRREHGEPRFGEAGATTFAVLLALALFGALFPWFPGETRLEVGSTASRTLTAPRDLSYESAVLTAVAREQSAAAVPDVRVHDPGIHDAQLAELNRQLAAIERVRANGSLSASARESALLAIGGVSSLSARGAAVIASVTESEWTALVAELRGALGRTLAVAITDGGVADARQRVRGLLTPLLSNDQALALGELADPLVVATQVVDAARTAAEREKARDSRPPVLVTVTRGRAVVTEGEILEPEDIERLDELGLRTSGLRLSTLAATALIAGMVGVAGGGYLFVVQPGAVASFRRLVLFGLLMLVPMAASKFAFTLLLPDLDRQFLAYAVPLAAAPIAAAVLLDVTTALLVTVALASVTAFVTLYLPEVDFGATGQVEAARMWLVVVAASLAGIAVAARADRLQRYLAAGVASALAAGAALVVFWLLDPERGAVDLLWIGGAAAVGGITAALISVGAFVLLSRPFGIITRVELMELAQLSHPLLQRLQNEAPGTFQHSVLVGNLAERAADRIGADALLVRIGSYYHDIGKLVGPEFFYENVGEGENPHDGLDPLQSTRVIHQHVNGGTEIARRGGLPEAVVQFIPQHHGTRLVTFFYRRAAEADAEIDPELFRYAGPKPQSREAALVMLSDSCEAAVRASPDHSDERIGEVIEGIIRERLEEEQFDECDLSLRDLRLIAESFGASLNAVYHPRVEYPEPTERELAGRAAGTATPEPEVDDGSVPEGPPLAMPETTLPEATASAAGVRPPEPPEDDA